MRREAYVKAWNAWAPGVASAPEWAEWVAGSRSIERSQAAPPLGHLSSLFKRRLSQLSRMVLHVGHELCPGPRQIRTVFASEYGEIGQQLKLTASLIETGEIAPSAFSLSVFNTPVALLSIAEKNTEGSIVLNAGPAAFETGLWEALALREHSGDPEVLMITADEMIPAPFDELAPQGRLPHALGLLLCGGPGGGAVRLELGMAFGRLDPPEGAREPSALRFLRWFLGDRLQPLSLGQVEYTCPGC
jgi:hypothetical protein